MDKPTGKDIERAYLVTLAIAEAIKELGRVPSGHLYAHLTGVMNLETYLAAVDVLKEGGVIREESHELIWQGVPEIQVDPTLPLS